MAETDLGAWSWQVEKGHKRFANDPKADAWNPRETDQPRLPAIASDRVESIVTVYNERPTSALHEKRPVKLRYRFLSRADAELAARRFQQVFDAFEHARQGNDEAARMIQLKFFRTYDIRVKSHDCDVRVEAPEDGEVFHNLLDTVLESPVDTTTTGDGWEKTIRKLYGPRDYY